jgi:hypothetical protein
VSSVPTSQSGEVGGLQNTATNLGASLGTALAGSILIAVLTSSFIAGVQHNPAVPAEVKQQASVQLAAGVPFLSDGDLEKKLREAGASQALTDSVVADNSAARVAGLDAALGVLALLALVSLFFTGRLPNAPVGSETPEEPGARDLAGAAP